MSTHDRNHPTTDELWARVEEQRSQIEALEAFVRTKRRSTPRLRFGRISATIVTIAAALLLTTNAFASIPDANGVIHACVYKGGLILIIDSATQTCKGQATSLTWSQIGSQGPQGLQGPKGDVGARGPQGSKGDTGAMGAPGPQGLKGDTGAMGAPGPQGLKGDTGATGARGPQGLKGDTGATGAPGPQGVQGPAGPPGLAATAGVNGINTRVRVGLFESVELASTTITLSSPGSIVATGAVSATITASHQNNEVACHLEIDGTRGPFQFADITSQGVVSSLSSNGSSITYSNSNEEAQQESVPTTMYAPSKSTGTHTISLYCSNHSGTSNSSVDMNDASLVAFAGP